MRRTRSTESEWEGSFHAFHFAAVTGWSCGVCEMLLKLMTRKITLDPVAWMYSRRERTWKMLQLSVRAGMFG